MLERNIFIFWMQGWENANWLNKQVAESWKINNPDWTVHLLDMNNLKDYLNDIDYIYDKNKNITPVNISDIIRISLLKNLGGVWADATMLCMQPLDHWVDEAVEKTGFWMYRGYSAKIPKPLGPASWFIISKKNSYIISEWKIGIDNYWNTHNCEHVYQWLDDVFGTIYFSNAKFKKQWEDTPMLYCELDGQSHTLAVHGMENNNHFIKQCFLEKPPYALKFWSNHWKNLFPDINSYDCQNSNGYFAIQMSKRCFRYKHIMY
jgi:hypothetical protein